MVGYIVAYEAVKSADLRVDLMIASKAVGLVTRTVARWLSTVARMAEKMTVCYDATRDNTMQQEQEAQQWESSPKD